jgi:exosome complex exonuclease DIS3/RRP44
MSAQRSFVKKTKAGRVMKVVREHYLRDDIYVGCELATEEYRGPDPSAWKLSAGASKFVVIDTNVALHQLDFLAHKSIADVVVLSVVLEECRNRSKSSYDRLRAMCQDPTKRFFVFANEHHRDTYIKAEPGESPNDRNDRAIRVAAKFYRPRDTQQTHRAPDQRPGQLAPGQGGRRRRAQRTTVRQGTRG